MSASEVFMWYVIFIRLYDAHNILLMDGFAYAMLLCCSNTGCCYTLYIVKDTVNSGNVRAYCELVIHLLYMPSSTEFTHLHAVLSIFCMAS